jgi:hypothetical protein
MKQTVSRHPAAPQPAWRHVFVRYRLAACVAALTIACCSRAGAQSVWELMPYRVRTLIAFAPRPELTDRLRRRIEAYVSERVDVAIGAAWNMRIGPPPAELLGGMLGGLADVGLDDLPPEIMEGDEDKLLLVTIRVTDGGFSIEARDYDLHARLVGSLETRQIAGREELPGETFNALLAAFAPLAQIERVDEAKVVLRLRAASLTPLDPEIVWVRPGDVFRPIMRFNDRDGTLKRLMPLDWTFLSVAELSGAEVTCTMFTGLKNPLSARRRGRIEQLALLARPTGGSTRLELRSRPVAGDPESSRPLAGYAVYAHPAGLPKTVLLGRTDGHGLLTVPADESPVRILLIKHGGEPMARLPLMPGLEPVLRAEVPDDDQRLAAEGLIAGFQENFVDLIARRAVLMRRIRLRLDENQLEQAKAFMDELRRLPRQEDLLSTLTEQRQEYSTDDPRMRKKIGKLFDDTQEIVVRYMNMGDLNQLEHDLQERLRAAGAATPAAAVNAPPAAAAGQAAIGTTAAGTTGAGGQ